jgi:competence protein ComEA
MQFFSKICQKKKEITDSRCKYISRRDKMERIKNPLVLGIIIACLLLSNIGTIIYFVNVPNSGDESICLEEEKEDEESESLSTMIQVDIKGYVKKPGVYEIEEGSSVNDLINTAGGLKSNGTTDNLNLSKKLVDESVIVVLSKTQLKNKNQASCTTSTDTTTTTSTTTNGIATDSIYLVEDDTTTESSTTTTSSKVNINTATKEELMNLSGIGESKAIAIIAYRENQKFTTIEEITNVSGIGDSIYEKIKDNITV